MTGTTRTVLLALLPLVGGGIGGVTTASYREGVRSAQIKAIETQIGQMDRNGTSALQTMASDLRETKTDVKWLVIQVEQLRQELREERIRVNPRQRAAD